MQVYAHRGASKERPENTLAAFDRAIALGVAGIELDVHLSCDGAAVVIHDDTVDRTTNGTGSVAGLTQAELRLLDAGDGERIPTLAEVLDLVGDRAHLDIEVKATAAAHVVLREVRSRSALRWAISSFDHDVLRQVRAVDANADLWPITPAASDDALQTIREIGATHLAIWDRGVDADIVQLIVEHGARPWVWTVNDPDRAAELAAWSVEGICTDDPAAILEQPKAS